MLCVTSAPVCDLSPVLVARPEPVDVTFLQDDVLSAADQLQVVRLHPWEVVEGHHHFLLLLLVILLVFVLRDRRRTGPALRTAGRRVCVSVSDSSAAAARFVYSPCFPVQESEAKVFWKLEEEEQKPSVKQKVSTFLFRLSWPDHCDL